MLLTIALFPFVIWLLVLILPWQPWRTRESWDTAGSANWKELNDITVLIPARNEEEVLGRSLTTLRGQGNKLKIILIDDRSEDQTARLAKKLGGPVMRVLSGKALPPGWSGKLWALEQGLVAVDTSLTLLLDADIAVKAGVVAGLKEKMIRENKDFVSLMAMPSLFYFWEKLLMPAFVYFFKLLYPFSLSNSKLPWVATAAGGCILVKTQVLKDIAAFSSLRGALIDDCTLARRVKNAGFSIWIGLTHSIRSIRPYPKLTAIWNMVARTAYTQLHYSPLLLLLCTLIMALAFIAPLALAFYPEPFVRGISMAALVFLFISYLPTLLYYRLSPLWALSLPLVGVLFLGMTWTSAIRYWKGERMRWRGRVLKA